MIHVDNLKYCYLFYWVEIFVRAFIVTIYDVVQLSGVISILVMHDLERETWFIYSSQIWNTYVWINVRRKTFVEEGDVGLIFMIYIENPIATLSFPIDNTYESWINIIIYSVLSYESFFWLVTNIEYVFISQNFIIVFQDF